MTPEIFREALGLAGFAWGVFAWAMSRRDKKALEQRESIAALFNGQSIAFNEKFTEQKIEITDLKKSVTALQVQMSSIQAQVEDLKSLTRLGSKISLESARLVELSVGNIQNKLESFGKVIVRE